MTNKKDTLTSPLSPEAVAQMVADLDLFSRCGDVGVMDRDMAIDAKAMITTLADEKATLRASEAAALERVGAIYAIANELSWSPKTRSIADRLRTALTHTADKEPKT